MHKQARVGHVKDQSLDNYWTIDPLLAAEMYDNVN